VEKGEGRGGEGDGGEIEVSGRGGKRRTASTHILVLTGALFQRKPRPPEEKLGGRSRGVGRIDSGGGTNQIRHNSYLTGERGQLLISKKGGDANGPMRSGGERGRRTAPRLEGRTLARPARGGKGGRGRSGMHSPSPETWRGRRPRKVIGERQVRRKSRGG